MQGNFILDATRQKIVKGKDWNTALLRGVVQTFCEAVEDKFCVETDDVEPEDVEPEDVEPDDVETDDVETDDVETNDPLYFGWVRFLPLTPSDQFWEPLPTVLKDLILEKRLFVSAQATLKLLSELRNLPASFFHEEEPLLLDTPQDVFISGGYEPEHINILKAIGLLDLSDEEMLERVEWDLRDKKCSSLYNTDLGDNWHTSFMMLIEELWRDPNCDRKRLQRLKIIPLSNDKWISLEYSSFIFNPFAVQEDSVQVQIPKNLHRKLLHPKAYGDAERRSAYASFGISDYKPELLVQKVLGSHSDEFEGDLEDAVAHFEILFWYQGLQFNLRTSPKQRLGLWAFDEKERSKRSHMLFFPSEEEYGASQLLSFTDHEGLGEYGFIHERYMKSRMNQHVRKGNSWLTWLSNCAGVRWFPALVVDGPSSNVLNPVFELVARDNPSMLVPALQRHWSSYRDEDWRAVVQNLEELEALCCGCVTKPLKETVLPTKKILTKCQELNLEGEISVLELPDSPMNDADDSWDFLHNFGVVCHVNLKFYLAALQAVRTLDAQANDIQGTYSKICKGISDIAGDNDMEFLQVCR